jgi:hypothetical protein
VCVCECWCGLCTLARAALCGCARVWERGHGPRRYFLPPALPFSSLHSSLPSPLWRSWRLSGGSCHLCLPPCLTLTPTRALQIRPLHIPPCPSVTWNHYVWAAVPCLCLASMCVYFLSGCPSPGSGLPRASHGASPPPLPSSLCNAFIRSRNAPPTCHHTPHHNRHKPAPHHTRDRTSPLYLYVHLYHIQKDCVCV